MARDDPQMKIRLPEDLKARVDAAAEAGGRTLNAEIVRRLENSFSEVDLGEDMKMRAEQVVEYMETLRLLLESRTPEIDTAVQRLRGQVAKTELLQSGEAESATGRKVIRRTRRPEQGQTGASVLSETHLERQDALAHYNIVRRVEPLVPDKRRYPQSKGPLPSGNAKKTKL